MVVTSVSLENFRNYRKTAISFSPWTTLLVGSNGSGKTNILEALTLVSTGKSFRADKDAEMIGWGEEIATVRANTDDIKLTLMLTTGMFSGKHVPTKRYLVNGVPRRMVDFVGNMRIVLFWPEHLELVTDSPSLRRKYLDSVLVQVDREYRRTLVSYERGLRQRNRLLDFINEGKASSHQLLFWNQLLIRTGTVITDTRAAYITYINAHVSPVKQYTLHYDKSVISEARLIQYKEEEIAAKATLVGPHRDDIVFFMQRGKQDTRDVSKYGSRGEQRLAILWLKLAEIAFVTDKTGQRPVLLLDDIFSELDEQHKNLVLDLLGSQQTIVSSAEEELVRTIVGKMGDKCSIIHLPLE